MTRTLNLLPVLLLLLSTACATYHKGAVSDYAMSLPSAMEAPAAPMLGEDYTAPAETIEVNVERMMIWSADVTVEVADVDEAVQQATEMAQARGGFVQDKTQTRDERAHLKLRIPKASFQSTVDAMDSLGEVTERSVTGRDVTEEYADVQARLMNRVSLRDRLKVLLERAEKVEEVLKVEIELNRVQTEIDSMDARLRVLSGQVEFADVDLTLKRETIYGPLGLMFKGLEWTIEKLFYIRQ